ncbi:hypothetical protein K503DRAFT_805096 [Rhizopogon vinicolor AM-OR11-026]|uniref:Uncharacterized protein n=1 Tax=Rhizopogon vinicolor AM-OR11-026 TaxID=1314800 RepID=A0A1B7MJ19_9AGAM|nr:hypothetical protein K503DRAFT_805096 [Rhizopogon vinicolor AM-OR11-026]
MLRLTEDSQDFSREEDDELWIMLSPPACSFIDHFAAHPFSIAAVRQVQRLKAHVVAVHSEPLRVAFGPAVVSQCEVSSPPASDPQQNVVSLISQSSLNCCIRSQLR